MILAVPVARMARYHRMGAEHDYFDEQSVWWHFVCTVCGFSSENRARFSHPASALERGHNYHLVVEQCETVGQLDLFPEMTP